MDHSNCGKKDKCDCTGTPNQKACADCLDNFCDACEAAEYPEREKLAEALDQFEDDNDFFDDEDFSIKD